MKHFFKNELYLFMQKEGSHNFSMMNDFLSLLKYYKVKQPYKFSYVGEKDTLIKELTLLENLVMDFVPTSLTDSKEFQFQHFLKNQKNKELEELFLKIGYGHELASNADAQMKKICCLIKSLIFEGEYIFLESPEDNLSEENLFLFIRALQNDIAINNKIVFINSKRLHFWKNFGHQVISRNSDHSFRITSLKDESSFISERTKFYDYRDQGQNLNKGLKFHIPKSKKKKKTAA